MRLFLVLAITVLLATPALAQSWDIAAPGETVPGQVDLTYLDLLRHVAPGLSEIGGTYEGVLDTPLRSLMFADETPSKSFGVAFSTLYSVPFRSDGQDLLALMLNTDNGAAVMAIFDPAAQKLVDIADVAADQNTSFDQPVTLRLGAEDDGLVVSSYHSNSSQGYRMTSVIALLDGQLQTVADVFTLRESYCGVDRRQGASFTAGEGQPGRWQPFTITVTEVTLPPQDECGNDEPPEPGTRTVAATYLWNEARGTYEATSDALDRLYEQTEARF